MFHSLSCHVFHVCLEEGFAPVYSACVQQLCQTQKFSLLCDETMDQATDKQLVILAGVINGDHVATRFVDIPTCNLSTAQHLFDALNKSLQYVLPSLFS